MTEFKVKKKGSDTVDTVLIPAHLVEYFKYMAKLHEAEILDEKSYD